MHFCADELMAIMAALPFVGFVLHWARSKFRTLRGKK